MTKTIVHKGIFLVLFGIFMKNAEGRLDSSFLTSTLFSLFHLNFPKANMKLHPLSTRCELSCLKFKRPGTVPLKQMSKNKQNEDPNIHCLRTVLGGKSLVSCVFGSRFDVTGAAGACLKRYTDPSFFKMEWAKSELMKAQHTQLYKKANIEKVKSIFAAVNFLSFLTFLSIHWLRIFTRDHNTAPLL